jgi:hypothetical protein
MRVIVGSILGACAGLAAFTGAVVAQETPVGILADHIRTQGFACKTPETATRDPALSKPNEAVWVLRCDGVTYRIRLVPDMAAKVERVS